MVIIKDKYTRYTNDFNVWKKRSLNKIGLVKWKSLRNNLPWCQKGAVQTTLSEVMCIPVSRTVLGLVQSPEDSI